LIGADRAVRCFGRGHDMFKSMTALVLALALFAGALSAVPQLVVRDTETPPNDYGHSETLNLGSKTGEDPMMVEVVIFNAGTADLTLQGMEPITFSNFSNIFVSNITYNGGFVIGPGAGESLTFQVDPDKGGSFSVNLNIASDDPDHSTYTVRIRGNTGTEKKDSGCSSGENTGTSMLLLLGLAAAMLVALRLRRAESV
jgi:hypothetical protein